MTNKQEQTQMNAREIEKALRQQVPYKVVERWMYDYSRGLDYRDKEKRAMPPINWKAKLKHPFAYMDYTKLFRGEERMKSYLAGRSSHLMDAKTILPHPMEIDEVVLLKFALDLAQKRVPQLERIFGVSSEERQPFQEPGFSRLLETYYPHGHYEGSLLFCRDKEEFARWHTNGIESRIRFYLR